MIEESKSINTYIEFSFEKSLRKYQKPPYKKIKPNLSSNYNKQSLCKHCVCKLSRKDNIHSTDRKVNLHNCRKNQLMRSRCKARQYSQIKRKNSGKKSAQNSQKKQKQTSRKNSKQKGQYPHVLSEFNVSQHLRSSDRINKQKLDKNSHGTKNQIKNQMQIQQSIQKFFYKTNCSQCKVQEEKQNEEFSLQAKQKIIQEQEESFSQISIAQSNIGIIQAKISQQVHIQKNIDKEQNNNESCQHRPISFQYFSSCSSVKSFSSQIEENEENQTETFGAEEIQSVQKQTLKQNATQDVNPFAKLKLESKEQLKKQYLDECRQRIFYKIKKINEVDRIYSECESISEELKKQLIEPTDQQQKTRMIEKSLQEQVVSQNQISQPQSSFYSQKDSSQNDGTSLKQEQQNPFKRNAPSSAAYTEGKRRNKKKSKRINFQIDQNYQTLGRVRITGLGEENQQICLSVRRVKNQLKNFSYDPTHIREQYCLSNKTKIVDQLILQRPYLEKRKSQLLELVQAIIF